MSGSSLKNGLTGQEARSPGSGATHPFGDRANIAFAACQPRQPPGWITLYDVVIGPTTVEYDVVLYITAGNPPSNEYFDCPLVTLCDDPAFTKLCVNGGALCINKECFVPVEEHTWSEIKGLFR